MARLRRESIGKASPNLSEIGSSGLTTYGGQIAEESMRQLVGTKGIKVFADMRDNDDTVGAFLFIIDKLLRNVKWKVKSADETPEAKECAEFLDSCMNDMEHSWSDLISEILSMLVFGWSAHEIVYKIRSGMDTTNKSYFSQFEDKKIGWRKLPIRPQETLYSWEFDESDDVKAMNQLPPNRAVISLPIDKLLIFRTQSYKNNPMGRSILRNAFRPWTFKKRIEEVEGIGIERDLAGLPVAGVPAEILASNATAEQKATLSAIKRLVTNIRRDEQEGVVFPLVYDDSGNKLYTLELLSTGGTRQFDTNSIITRYSKAIAMTVMADFIYLGQTKSGSYALSSDKTDMFAVGLGTCLDIIKDQINKIAVPKLMKLNGYDRKLWPTAMPSDIEKEDVSKFCDNIYKLVGVGALIADDEVDKRIRDLLDIPATTASITPLSQLEEEMAAAKLQQENDQKNIETQNKLNAQQPEKDKQNMPGPKGQKGGRSVGKA
jgi:hypothetical protein